MRVPTPHQRLPAADSDTGILLSTSSGENLERSTSLWFEDGNIVIQAQDTVFRVYKGVLSRESAIFRSMFSLPQSESSLDTYEDTGCPLLVVHDEVADMELFLTVIFDHTYVHLFFSALHTVSQRKSLTISALEEECGLVEYIYLLEISSKYEATRLLRRISGVLSHFFPDTAEGHDHLIYDCDDSCSFFKHFPPADGSECIACGILALMVDAVEKSGVFAYIPAALLHATCDSTQRLFRCTAVSKYCLKVELESMPEPGIDMHSVCVGFWPMFRKRIFRTLFVAQYTTSLQCKTPPSCRAGRHAIIEHIEDKVDGTLAPFIRLIDPDHSAIATLCDSCRRNMLHLNDEVREVAWNILPTILSLPSWVEMRATREELFADVH